MVEDDEISRYYATQARKFPLGHLVATPGALARVPAEEQLGALARHVRGEWGDALCAEDVEANEKALVHGNRLFSAYHSKGGVKFYVITEADRTVTTVLLPEDY